MPGSLPEGEPAPSNGELPLPLVAAAQQRPISAYVHIPFCSSRCGYCDFTTYTPTELGIPAELGVAPAPNAAVPATSVPTAIGQSYVDTLLKEIQLARKVLPISPPLQSVFFGGGTPTLLPAEQLGRILQTLQQLFGLDTAAEVTTEANPETITEAYLQQLLDAGFNRISLGMQSASEHVLATLQRRHTPGQAVRAAAMANAAGFAHVSLDLIYGTPGESQQDWQHSLELAVQAGVDHISAYALIVEPGTRLAGLVRRGQIAAPDDDMLADRYLQCDSYLSAQGFSWYEVSNWARQPDAQCQHNLAYWRGDNWWGFGTGAHSHLAAPGQGLRWWNVRHPRDYSAALTQGNSPAAGRELLDPTQLYTEKVLLELRLADGLPLAELSPSAQANAQAQVDAGLLDPSAWSQGRLVLTVRGRLLADAVVRTLLD